MLIVKEGRLETECSSTGVGVMSRLRGSNSGRGNIFFIIQNDTNSHGPTRLSIQWVQGFFPVVEIKFKKNSNHRPKWQVLQFNTDLHLILMFE